MTTNKYFELTKKTTIDYKERRIDTEDFKKTFEKLDETEIYKDLKKNGYLGVSNYISAIAEIDDQTTLESQWIIEIINLFYCYFIDNYDSYCAKDFYKFLKIGLNKENKNPVKISFKLAIQDYVDKKINDYCLAYIASEFLNNLKFFEKEIKENKKLFDILITASKLKPNKLLEDLTSKEIETKKAIDKKLEEYLKNN
jgi:hypothetical protein